MGRSRKGRGRMGRSSGFEHGRHQQSAHSERTSAADADQSEVRTAIGKETGRRCGFDSHLPDMTFPPISPPPSLPPASPVPSTNLGQSRESAHLKSA